MMSKATTRLVPRTARVRRHYRFEHTSAGPPPPPVPPKTAYKAWYQDMLPPMLPIALFAGAIYAVSPALFFLNHSRPHVPTGEHTPFWINLAFLSHLAVLRVSLDCHLHPGLY